jgi:hypothetical protein
MTGLHPTISGTAMAPDAEQCRVHWRAFGASGLSKQSGDPSGQHVAGATRCECGVTDWCDPPGAIACCNHGPSAFQDHDALSFAGDFACRADPVLLNLSGRGAIKQPRGFEGMWGQDRRTVWVDLSAMSQCVGQRLTARNQGQRIRIDHERVARSGRPFKGKVERMARGRIGAQAGSYGNR